MSRTSLKTGDLGLDLHGQIDLETSKIVVLLAHL